MAALQKIRSKGPLLVIIIGLALFAFIAEEAMRSIQTASSESKQRVGEIYKEKLSVQDFQNMVDEYAEVVKFTNGMGSLNDEQMTQLRDQVWNTYVNNKLIEHEAELLGLTVTDAEVQSIINSGKSPLLMQTPFRNEKTGAFDVNVLKKFLTDYEGIKSQTTQMPAEYIEYYTKLYNLWTFIEKTIREETLISKYQTLLSKSLLSNKIVNQAAFNDRNNESNILLAALPYTLINDKDIKVDDADLKAKYEEMKESFKQIAETRDIKYIDVEVQASAADKAALDKEMQKAYNKLTLGGDFAKIVRESGSTISYSELPVSKNALPRDIANEIDSMSAGQTKAPYYFAGDNTMNTIKLISKVSAPDSIQFQQIQVSGADAAVVKHTADSIMTALNQGAPFDSIAKKYGQNADKTWMTSRQYEGATMDPENMNFIKTLNKISVNGVEKIDFTQGSIIVKVTDRRAMIDKYDIAVVKRPVEFSKETYTKAYNDFSHFIASNATLKDIEANALKNGYNLQSRNDLMNSEHYVGGIRSTQEAMRWIFNEDTDINSVSPMYECGENDHMLVVILTGVHQKGYRSMEDVKDILTKKVMEDKKAEMLKEKMANAKSIADVMKVNGAVSDTINHVSFSASTFVSKVGYSEPIISGAASKAENGKFISPLKGNGGVYAFQVLSKNKTAEKYDAKSEEMQQESMNMRAVSRFVNDLYEKANVKDNRYLFF